MITIHNIEKAKNIGYNNWRISRVVEGMDADKDVYAFAVEMNGSIMNIFYLNKSILDEHVLQEQAGVGREAKLIP